MVQVIHGAALALAVALAPAAARADRDGGAQVNGLHDVTVAGAGGAHRLAGTLDIQRFEAVDGAVVAVGLLRGTLTDRAGNVASFAEQAVAIPVATGDDHDRGTRDARSTRRMGGLRALVVPAQVKTVCTVLDRQLVPADLNLLGLVVTTGPIVVRIGANPGPGNLLGNLLCTVLGLLDNFTAASAGALANTLNQVLAAA